MAQNVEQAFCFPYKKHHACQITLIPTRHSAHRLFPTKVIGTHLTENKEPTPDATDAVSMLESWVRPVIFSYSANPSEITFYSPGDSRPLTLFSTRASSGEPQVLA
jgi:hypothetical protein